jgi:hypothetical protein
MSLFRSLYTRYEQEEEIHAGSIRPWPATYREPLPAFDLSQYSLLVRIENQIPKSINWKQLHALPSFTENRRLTSKAGWTYYGQWKGVSFQTLFSLFSTPNLYPWVRLESLNGEHALIERTALLNYRVLFECDGEALTTIYGGPLMVHNFDHYLEYSIPHLKSIILLQGEHQPYHPHTAIGFLPEKARVEHGRYYDIHHERMTTL